MGAKEEKNIATYWCSEGCWGEASSCFCWLPEEDIGGTFVPFEPGEIMGNRWGSMHLFGCREIWNTANILSMDSCCKGA